MLNLGSLILGICAWLFGGLAIRAQDSLASHKDTFISFSLCAVSVLLQLFEIGRRVSGGDFAAVEDTIRAVQTAAVALVSVTVILGLIASIKAKKK
jgi:hypothetical protein